MPNENTAAIAQDPKETGVLLLQIDGLSRYQFERAVRAGRMPFCKKLLDGSTHHLTTFYPGQPSCTPAVQAEIFFGVRCATPAFSFYDRESKQSVRMYEAEWARRIGEESKEQGDGLLKGGSSYANIYVGGAEKAKYCGELNTLAHWTKELSLLKWLKIFAKYPVAGLRIAKLLAIEIGVGLFDAVRGILDRGDILAELKFIPARLGVAIALREAIRSEVISDIKNGLPVVHANFFGYDEGAHRRGPHSKFAHWSLKGIDRTIRKIVKTASKSQKRNYEVIVFSDHGQESVVPYREHIGEDLHEVTENLFARDGLKLSPRSQIVSYMERSKNRLAAEIEGTNEENSPRYIHIESLGPVAHIYVDDGLSDEEKASWAVQYSQKGDIPVVIYIDREGDIQCRMGAQTGSLDLLSQKLDKRGHEFTEQALHDLEILIRSKYAGDLVLLGWRTAGKPITFAYERGAHAGPGAEECRGFVITPSSANIHASWMRPLNLRNIVLRYLDRAPAPVPEPKHEVFLQPSLNQVPFRIVSYNVHGGVGTDGKKDLDRLASVIVETDPEIICFQEAFESIESGAFSLRETLARKWGDTFTYEFLELHQKQGVRYGLAVASKQPFKLRKALAYEIDHAKVVKREPRGAIWVEFENKDNLSIHLINTHFGLRSWERQLQASTLLGPGWLEEINDDESVIVCGDFNAGPNAPVYQAFSDKLSDTQLNAAVGKPAKSFISWAPVRRIDHIFTSKNLKIPAAGVHRSAAAKKASDHLPVYADMKL